MSEQPAEQNRPRTIVIDDDSLWAEFEQYAKATGISVERAIMAALYAFMGAAR